MDDPVKKEFPHNIFKPKQNWEFIDKWFDDYGHTLEPREIARWAYCNGRWKHIEIGEAEIRQMLDDIEYYQNRVEELEKAHVTKKPKLKVLNVKMNGDTLDVYVDTNEEGRKLLMESAINQSFANLCNDNIHKLSWWKRFKYAWKNAR